MAIRPILSALSRNATGALLIALQIALTMAIITNATFILRERTAYIERPSGLDEENTLVAVTTDFAADLDSRALLARDLDHLNAMPGVRAAIVSHSVPVSGSGNGETYQVARDTPSNEAVSFGNFSADENGLEALGLELVAGRNFRPEEIRWRTLESHENQSVVLVSQALADALFPDGNAVGQLVWEGPTAESPTEIIGVYDEMQNAWPTSSNVDRTSLQPFRDLSTQYRHFIIRAEPGQRDRVLSEVEQYLGEERGRMLYVIRTYEEQKRRTYAQDIAMVRLLTGVVVVLGTITAFGIVGLAWFSVTQRRKQIGTRRALGARKRDVMAHFMIENWLITTLGLILGTAGALALNWFLDTEYQVGRMPLWYLPAGVLALWVLGQLAVLAPARRAAAVPPALATRSV
ncbi:ABC transporter permease [Elongatibacter sediminis]|uniref:FtsX-like permease family protein n=1 Tax=Elongatibacter sediminis TaxID=3119006 RepID=A0AAW9R9N9_9GAMM